MRALGKVAKEFDLPGFEEFRIAHSQILNQKTINGTLYLSIHPLDFMTMSDNNCDWDSCMSWVDGEYKQGTVEMMNSDCVVVAYITNEHEDFWFSNKYSWNNKRWRELFIVDRGLITGIKGYPYENEDIEKIVCEWLKELAETNLGWNYNDEYIHYVQRRIIDKETMPFYVHFKTHKMYNDFHSRERYGFFNPDYIMTKIKNTNRPDRYHLVYSGFSECMWCGDVFSDISSYSLICDNCNETIYCEHCHCELIDPDSYVYVKETGQYFCEDCYEYVSSFECALCHDTIRAYPTTTLDIANLDENLIVICEYRQSICSSCLEKLQKRNAIILISSTNTPDFFRLAVDWSKLTDEEKKEMFGWTPNDDSWLDSIDVLNYRPFGSITYEIAQVKKYDSEFPF